MRTHALKPFPIGFYDNAKLKKQHLFIFDVLCRHLDADADGWIHTDSKTLIKVLKQTSGIKLTTPKHQLEALKKWGYIDMPANLLGSRSQYEREFNVTLFTIKILDSAWDPKGIVRPYEPQNRKEYMARRNAKRKAIHEQIKALLAGEDA
jgi:hypothetical protein